MTEETFKFIRDKILKGMPSGCLVTKNLVYFDIGKWQYKSYEDDEFIREKLRGKWCPRTINILEIDNESSTKNIINFIKNNDFAILQRDFYFIYCLLFDEKMLTEELELELQKSKFPMSKYSYISTFNNQCLFLVDFMKNILFI